MNPEFSEYIAELRPTLQRFTHHFTSDRDESEDLVQDTLLKALTYRDRFRTDTNLKGWLFTIMRNTYINGYRKTQRLRATQSACDIEKVHVEDRNTFSRPSESLEFKEIWLNVISVRDDHMIPFKMFITGYKYHEIAEHLGIPVGTVKNRIFQARKEVQRRLLNG
jgi:RNA polymerase sigma-70 factor (ECF subfamily)